MLTKVLGKSRSSYRKIVNYCRFFDCINWADREKHLKFYRLPKVIKKNRRRNAKKLSKELWRLWLAKLNQDLRGKNLDYVRLCLAHVLSGKCNRVHQFQTNFLT